VLDLRAVPEVTTVRFATGDERFTTLDTNEVEHPDPGEVIFVDDGGEVSARRWCWRQSEQSAARESTTDVLITIEGHHATAEQDVLSAMHDLVDLLVRYSGGTFQTALLSPENPHFTAA
jgi:DNA/RNA-binding domain of Phe-tRNA-synthetase-like protein